MQMLRWLLDRGEDPAEVCQDSSWHWTAYMPSKKDETKIDFEARNHSAVSFCLRARRDFEANMKKLGEEVADWTKKVEYCTSLLAMLYPACGNKTRQRQREKMSIDASIVDRWAKMWRDDVSHDVLLTCDDGSGTAGAHSGMLSLASPVVRAMLSSAMLEGQTKTIRVQSSKDAVDLFLEILYTGSLERDIAPPPTSGSAGGASSSAGGAGALPLASALAAHELAHSWDVPDVQALIERVLTQMLSDGSFFEIAEVAQLRGAAPLVDACVAFTASSSAVKAAVDAGRCAPAVLELLGKVQPGGPAKKQRLSL